jgi:hypothetical protein
MGIFSACSNKGTEAELLPKDKMAGVLWDMIQVDELATLRLIKDSSQPVKIGRIQLYEKVFRLHKTSEKQFSKSFSYYMDHPDVMKALFDSLEARGARERKLTYVSPDSLRK